MSKLPIEKLDRSRAYGEVSGENEHKIYYAQGALGIQSWPYDAHGDLIEGALNKEQRAKLDEKRKQRKLNEEAAAKAPKVKEEVEETAADEEVDAAAKKKSDDDSEINLEMWLKGEAKYTPLQLQGAVKQRYHVNKPHKQAIALFLVEEKKLIPRSLVHPSVLPPLKAEDAA